MALRRRWRSATVCGVAKR